MPSLWDSRLSDLGPVIIMNIMLTQPLMAPTKMEVPAGTPTTMSRAKITRGTPTWYFNMCFAI